jgi:hypothetical protein
MSSPHHVAILKLIQDWQSTEVDLENREREHLGRHPLNFRETRHLFVMASLIAFAETHSREETLDHLVEERKTWDGPRFSYQSAAFGREGEANVFNALFALECAWDALTGIPLDVIQRRFHLEEQGADLG